MSDAGQQLTFRTMQTQADADAFRSLNEEWIVKLFRLEEPDRATLGDPWRKIVEPGGEVYLAVCCDEIVGCAALVWHADGVYELAKMAVSPHSRGMGVGRRLLSYVLQQAGTRNAHTIVLGSSTRLENAVHLYESFGFRHVPASELPVHYERATVWMKLSLREV